MAVASSEPAQTYSCSGDLCSIFDGIDAQGRPTEDHYSCLAQNLEQTLGDSSSVADLEGLGPTLERIRA